MSSDNGMSYHISWELHGKQPVSGSEHLKRGNGLVNTDRSKGSLFFKNKFANDKAFLTLQLGTV